MIKGKMGMLELFLAIILLSLTFLLVLIKIRLSYWKKRHVPHLRPEFLFGNVRDLFSFKRSEFEILDEIYKKFKGSKVCGAYYLWKPVLLVTDPELLKRIFVSDFTYFINHPEVTSVRKSTDRIAWSLFFMRDEEWKNRRAMLSTIFTPKRLKLMYEGVENNCRKILPFMDQIADSGEDVEMEGVGQRYAINVITSTLFGLSTDTIDNSSSIFLKCGKLVSHPDLKTTLKFLLFQQFPSFCKAIKMNTFDPSIWNFFYRFVKDVITMREAQSYNKDDLLGLMIKAKNDPGSVKGAEDLPWTLEEITGHVFAFFEAGYDTTALTTAYCIYELSVNPHIQTKLREEIDQVLDKYDDKLCYEALQNMPYMNAVLAETLRKYPPAGVIKRESSKDYTFPDSQLTIPAGSYVYIPVYSLHHDPEYFPEPEKFIPERFLSEDKAAFMPVYMPFGKGPRICAGMKLAEMEIGLALALFLSNYEFGPSSKMKLPIRVDKKTLFVSSRAADGLWVSVKRRTGRKDV